MRRTEAIIRKFEPRRGKCPVTVRSAIVSVLWATLAAVVLGVLFGLLSGCVSVGYMNRRLEAAHQDRDACLEKLETANRTVDDLRALGRDAPAPAPANFKIDWSKRR